MRDAFTLLISYDQLLLLVIGLFMFVGATRGWRQEFISSCVLLVLTGVLIQPELAAPIIDYVARCIRLIVAFLQGFGSLDFAQLEARYQTIKLPFDGDNPYMLLSVVLVGFVIVSYSVRGTTKGLSALSRILGGLLGLFNGYLTISLFKEYVLKYFQKSSPALFAAASPSPQVSIAVQGVPTGDLLAGGSSKMMLLLLLVMVAGLFGTMIARRRATKKKKE